MAAQLSNSSNTTDQGGALVEMRDIWLSFPGVIANRGVDLDLRAGEVHALLGENGAGKTTLMRILSGLYRADAGTILLNGVEVRIHSPVQAFAAGIGMVHQHFRLVEKFTAAENIHLGWKETPRKISLTSLAKRTDKICHKFGLHIDPYAKVWQLSAGEQQCVEILRVLARGARILILDEPTAVLTPSEAEKLFSVMRSLIADGHSVVFISHKLDEVLEVSDRITILRAGRNVATKHTAECDKRLLSRFMVGEEVISQKHEKKGTKGGVILELRKAHASGDRGIPALINATLSVNAGQIVGVAGVAGNGQKELAEVITGLRSLSSGSVWLDGIEITGQSPRYLAQAGIGHVPEDRTGTGLVLSASVTHNAILREYRDPPIGKGLLLNNLEAKLLARELLDKAKVHVPSLQIHVRTLSGGNQQRLLAIRELRTGSRLLVVVHPTRGLDVVATNAIRQILIEHRNRGCAILLISEDLDEILALSDLIVVMSKGQIVGSFATASAQREQIGLLMGGSK